MIFKGISVDKNCFRPESVSLGLWVTGYWQY